MFSTANIRITAAAIAMAGLVSPAFAMPNPAPDSFKDDDNSSYFYQPSALLGLKIADMFPATFTFGFYFQGAPEAKIGIFGPGDTTIGNLVLVNFFTGTVNDLDQSGFPLVNEFPTSDQPIGFFLSTQNGSTIYSDHSLNPGNYDLVSTFPAISNASQTAYLIGFELPEVGPISLQLVAPLQPVPEPATWALLSVGCLGLLGWARHQKRI